MTGENRLWLLEISNHHPAAGRRADFDTCRGFVVRATSEDKARAIAARGASNSRDIELLGCNPWLRSDLTSCAELSAQGEEGIVLDDSYFP